MTRFAPASLEELREAVATALAAEEPVEVIAGGSKRGLGRPLQTAHTLDLSLLSGIREYAASELVLTAGAGTPIDEIERALAEQGQMLAFEPPDWRGLLGSEAAEPTLGGVLACNLSGPRRIKAGAARDHFLGFRAVSGRAEIFKAGGKVVKNVTGYDLCKLMAGSYGTLAALEEVTVKVLPRPEAVVTVLFAGIVLLPDSDPKQPAAPIEKPSGIERLGDGQGDFGAARRGGRDAPDRALGQADKRRGIGDGAPEGGGVLVGKGFDGAAHRVLAHQAVAAGCDRGRRPLDPQRHHPALQRHLQ